MPSPFDKLGSYPDSVWERPCPHDSVAQHYSDELPFKKHHKLCLTLIIHAYILPLMHSVTLLSPSNRHNYDPNDAHYTFLIDL
jgi:hypothetical protein